MSRHYSRIQQAARYQQALNNYVAYVQGKSERQPNIGNGKKRDASQTLYIRPFGVPATSSDLFTVSGSLPTWEEFSGIISGHAVATVATGKTAVKVRGFKASRVIIITGRAQDGTVKESHITKTKYLSYGGKSRSLPFGRAADADTELSVFTTIKSALTPAGSGNRVYLSPEKI